MAFLFGRPRRTACEPTSSVASSSSHDSTDTSNLWVEFMQQYPKMISTPIIAPVAIARMLKESFKDDGTIDGGRVQRLINLQHETWNVMLVVLSVNLSVLAPYTVDGAASLSAAAEFGEGEAEQLRFVVAMLMAVSFHLSSGILAIVLIVVMMTM